ncbi:MAG: flagellar motor switch phosphatase FliY [Alicyclobacillaceae bacterium]|nr:flagellar motor switch phosphatase FliY [Alicyclobacillaceae bacterium]
MGERDKLSQEEVDALLGKEPPFSDNPSQAGVSAGDVRLGGQDMTLLRFESADADTLRELSNISFGAAATKLSGLLRQQVDIVVSQVRWTLSDSGAALPDPRVVAKVRYVSGFVGDTQLILGLGDAAIIADLMLGGDGGNAAADLNDLHLNAIAEAVQQMMDGVVAALSSMCRRTITVEPPTVAVVLGDARNAPAGADQPSVVVEFRLRVGSLLDAKLIQGIPAPLVRDMLAAASAVAAETGPGGGEAATSEKARPSEPALLASGRAAAGADKVAGAMRSRSHAAPAAGSHAQTPPDSTVPRRVTVNRPEFPEFSGASGSPAKAAPAANLSLLYDVLLNVTVELGRTRRPIKEILELGPGSILELDKLAGEPVDILVNNKRIAVGEVVVIDENFGVRVTDIISPADRVKNLG